MSNIIEFPKKVEPDRFPHYELDPSTRYEEVWPIYEGPGVRLALLVWEDVRPTPFFLVLHDGAGGKAACLRIWQPEEHAAIGDDALTAQCIMAGRTLIHARDVLGMRTSVEEDAGHTDAL